ncbi:MAG: hypothetical protein KAQ72_05165, partial [Desulfobacula sp.]|nr:hypothetical protein [Desulfobacula sp.]
YEKILGGPFPYGVLEYIDNQLPDNSVIKGETKILLYYYYDRNQLFNPGEGKKESIKNIYRLVKNKALSNQILTSGNQKYKLYRIIPKNERKVFFKKRKLVFRTIFSNWTGKDTIPMSDISNAEPFLSLFGWRGQFVFKRISTEKDNIARLTMSNTRLFERPGIQFGFNYPSDKWPLDIKAGDIVSIHAQVRMSEQFDSKPELFIQDKTENRGWLRENLNWKQRKKKQKKWRSVLVTRKIRDGFTDIQMGIAWEPKSNEEWLEIKNINIYVTKEK